MKTYFISADIHGFYNEWMKALEEQQFDITNKNHIIVVLGDLLDRGLQAKECLKFVNSLPDERKILIRGNHEDLMEEAIARHYFGSHDISNGTVSSVIQITNCEYSSSLALQLMKEDDDWNKYINSTVDYAEVGDNIFVHGWIPCIRTDTNIYHSKNVHYDFIENWREDDWAAARWINGMNAWNQGVYIPGKTIWCGHWHTSWGHSNLHNDGVEWLNKIETYSQLEDGTTWPYAKYEPFEDTGIVAMDACTVISGIVNCKKIII